MMNDIEVFARLISAIAPWRDSVVIVGGWAHRLHRQHPDAVPPKYQPVTTRDADVAIGNPHELRGRLDVALKNAGFTEVLSGEQTPPVSHYQLGEKGGGFYVEFLAPLHGSGKWRDGSDDATVAAAGITAQKLRHLEVLLVAPWRLTTLPEDDIPVPDDAHILVANPVSFLAQKLLIQGLRSPRKRAQDILYIHDTIELFSGRLDRMQECWHSDVRPALSEKNIARIDTERTTAFDTVNDLIRTATRIDPLRRLSPETVRLRCALGLEQVFSPRETSAHGA